MLAILINTECLLVSDSSVLKPLNDYQSLQCVGYNVWWVAAGGKILYMAMCHPFCPNQHFLKLGSFKVNDINEREKK